MDPTIVERRRMGEIHLIGFPFALTPSGHRHMNEDACQVPDDRLRALTTGWLMVGWC